MSGELSRDEYVKEVFGNASRLDVWAAVGRLSIDPPEKFFTENVAKGLRGIVPTSVVRKEIKRLARLDMITPVEGGFREGQIGGQPPNWYTRNEHRLWPLVDLAVDIVESEFPSIE